MLGSQGEPKFDWKFIGKNLYRGDDIEIVNSNLGKMENLEVWITEFYLNIGNRALEINDGF